MDSNALDRVVSELCEIERRTGIERVLGIGELILNEFFGSDSEVWRDRRRNKGNSIRRLAEREDCPFSRSALNEAVAVYVAIQESPCVRTYGHITASHVAAVLPLPRDERESLLKIADRDRLGVRSLRAKVVELRRESGERRGRPRSMREDKLISIISAAERRLAGATQELEQLSHMQESTRKELDLLASACRELSSRLRRMSKKRDEVAA